jgi:hypothetical protein
MLSINKYLYQGNATMSFNLNKTQKDFLKWLVEIVRKDRYKEDCLNFTFGGGPKMFDGVIETDYSDNLVLQPSTLDALHREGFLYCEERSLGAYCCSLSGKAYEIVDRDFQPLPIEPKTVTYNNNLQGAQVVNFANELKDNAQQTASNFTQNDNTQLLQLIDELRHTIEALPTETQETINIDLDDITEEVDKVQDQRNPQRLKHRLQGIGNAIHNAATLLKDPGDIAKAINSLAGLANLCGIHLPPNS